jgi:hypothetical protein
VSSAECLRENNTLTLDSFLNNLPLLHFLNDRDAFASPTPLLLASILYISALHHRSSELAVMEAGYFAATCSAIAELVTPSYIPRSGFASTNDEEQDSPPIKKYNAFHNILGLIMASLSSEAYIDATGSWIAMAYRLWLDNFTEPDTSTPDWLGLFSGLQVRCSNLLKIPVADTCRSLISNMPQCTCPILFFPASLQPQVSNAWIATKGLPFRD